MRGFITIPTEACSTVLGIAQIASIEPGGKRGQHATLTMGNGVRFHALVSVDDVLDMIDEADAEVVDLDAPPQKPSVSEATGPIGAAIQETAAFTRETGCIPLTEPVN